jgi:hypothetical protein
MVTSSRTVTAVRPTNGGLPTQGRHLALECGDLRVDLIHAVTANNHIELRVAVELIRSQIGLRRW